MAEPVGALSDEALMARVQAGDERAFDELVARHMSPVTRFAYRMTHDMDDAQDVAQEALTRIWQHAARWEGNRVRFTTWLYRIAQNLCIDAHRRGRRLTSLDESAIVADGAAGDGAESDERTRALAAAVLELPESQRTALALCYFEGFSNVQAAEVLDLSVEALESLLARARRALKRRLSPD
jgi:RNA polymerase sigma-70 factor (ECF subfamily)